MNGAGRDVDFEWLSGWRTDGLTGEALMRTLGEEAVSDKGISKVRLANDLNADAELSGLGDVAVLAGIRFWRRSRSRSFDASNLLLRLSARKTRRTYVPGHTVSCLPASADEEGLSRSFCSLPQVAALLSDRS